MEVLAPPINSAIILQWAHFHEPRRPHGKAIHTPYMRSTVTSYMTPILHTVRHTVVHTGTVLHRSIRVQYSLPSGHGPVLFNVLYCTVLSCMEY